MSDNSRAMAATVVGAVIGGLVGYVLFTPQGRSLRRRLEPMLEDFVRELDSFRSTVARASSVAGEGWRVLNEAMSETGREASASSRYSNPHQTTPF